jgi:hypothetical protein
MASKFSGPTYESADLTKRTGSSTIFAAAPGCTSIFFSVVELNILAKSLPSFKCRPIGAALGIQSADSVERITSEIPSLIPKSSMSIRISSPQKAI